MLEISASSTVAEAYNKMRSITPTDFFEAKRTIEAIERVRVNELLLRRIREEETENGRVEKQGCSNA